MQHNKPILSPSLLAGNHAYLARDIQSIATHGIEWIHLDIMDGHFVPNLTFGPQTIADLRKTSRLFFDTHLMLDEPHRYIDKFAKASADLITIHVEPSYPVLETLREIRKLGCQNGIALNPDTPVKDIENFLEEVDLVLVMTVQPGFGGQSFRNDVLPKILEVDFWRRERGLNFRLEVDGGIDLKTSTFCYEKGCDTFVAGTAFFKAEDKKAWISSFETCVSPKLG